MICVNCGRAFERPQRSRRTTCSRPCAAAVSWQRNREQRIASIVVAQRRRGAEIAEQNRKRWARLGEREKLSARNREAWADPEMREKLTAGICRSHRRPEMRQFYSDLRRAMWQDPEYRARVTALIRRGHRTEEYRALFSQLLRERWQDPAWREKWSAATRRRYARPAAAKPAPAAPAPIPPVIAPERPLSAWERAEQDAIARFVAERGVAKLPSSREMVATDPLDAVVFNKETRKWRRQVSAAPRG